MRRSFLTAVVVLAVTAGATQSPQLASASATQHPAAALAAHKWRDQNYRRILLYGTWSRSARTDQVKGYIRDDRSDGKWVRVVVKGTDAGGREIAADTFFFNGGKRDYTAGPYRFGAAPVPTHVLVRACVVRGSSPFGKSVVGCGRWHRLY
jgi:hypothetical protein